MSLIQTNPRLRGSLRPVITEYSKVRYQCNPGRDKEITISKPHRNDGSARVRAYSRVWYGKTNRTGKVIVP